jgi:hypothetical protein
MGDIENVYLYGSHARGDASPDSDINVLVISNSDIPYKRMPGLNIEILSSDELKGYSKENPIDYYSIAGEAISLKAEESCARLAEPVLDAVNIDRFCAEARKGLKITERLLAEGDHAAAVYSLMLRLRGLYLIEKKPERYSHTGFEDYLSGKGILRDDFARFQDLYRTKRDDRCTNTAATPEEVAALKGLTEKILTEVEGIYLRRM